MAVERTAAERLAPGDCIRVPGGEGVVLAVEVERSLVRLEFRDRTGKALVFLPRTREVWRLTAEAT